MKTYIYIYKYWQVLYGIVMEASKEVEAPNILERFH